MWADSALKRDCSASAGGIGDPGVVLAPARGCLMRRVRPGPAELVTICTEGVAAVEVHHLKGQAAQPPASMGDTSWTSWDGAAYRMISYDMPHCHRLYFCILPYRPILSVLQPERP